MRRLKVQYVCEGSACVFSLFLHGLDGSNVGTAAPTPVVPAPGTDEMVILPRNCGLGSEESVLMNKFRLETGA